MEDNIRAKALKQIMEGIQEGKRVKSLVPEPACPQCGSGVDRPKCLLELGGDCPRHEIRQKWIEACRKKNAEMKKEPVRHQTLDF
jgi:hypothetical protein